MRLEEPGLQRDCAAIACRGCVQPAQRLQGGAEVVVGVGESRCERDDLFVARDGLLEATRLARDHGEIELQFGRLRIGGGEPAEAHERFGVLALPGERIRKHLVQRQRVGIAREQCTRRRLGARQPTRVQQIEQRLDLVHARLAGG